MSAPRFLNEFQNQQTEFIAYSCLVVTDPVVLTKHKYAAGARLLALAAASNYDYQLHKEPDIVNVIPPVGAMYPDDFWLYDLHERILGYTARAIRHWLDDHFIGLYSLILQSRPPLSLETMLNFMEVSTTIPKGMILRSIPTLVAHLHEEDHKHCAAFLSIVQEADDVAFEEPHDPLVLNICHLDPVLARNKVDFVVKKREVAHDGAYIFSVQEW